MTASERTPRSAVRAAYDDDYFEGRTSGYGPGGLAARHRDWAPIVRAVGGALAAGAPRTWLDVGCAFGHLPAAARDQGWTVAGLDPARAALARRVLATGLCRARARALPFGSGRFQVVSLCDLVEHLTVPEEALDEALRVLAPRGILYLTTPDVSLFPRREPTHVCERAPSHWTMLLSARGLVPVVRFGIEPWDVHLLAARDEQVARRLHELALPATGARLNRTGPPVVRRPNVPSGTGWDSAYFQAAAPGVSTVAGRIDVVAEGEARIFLDQRLWAIGRGSVRGLRLPARALAPGGHHVSVQSGTRARIARLALEPRPCGPDRYWEDLPFDQAQRYVPTARLLAAWFRRAPRTPRILEFGARGSHLPGLLPGVAWRGVDVTPDDRPHAVKAADPAAAGAERADAVVALDTLEHLPPEERRGAVERWRRASRGVLVLSFPTVEAAGAERAFHAWYRAFFGTSLPPLSEHETRGAVDPAVVASALAAAGWEYRMFPAGHLPVWAYLQCGEALVQHVPGFHDTQRRLRRLALAALPADRAAPSYRTFVVAWPRSRRPPCDPDPFSHLAAAARAPAAAQRLATLARQRPVPSPAVPPAGPETLRPPALPWWWRAWWRRLPLPLPLARELRSALVLTCETETARQAALALRLAGLFPGVALTLIAPACVDPPPIGFAAARACRGSFRADLRAVMQGRRPARRRAGHGTIVDAAAPAGARRAFRAPGWMGAYLGRLTPGPKILLAPGAPPQLLRARCGGPRRGAQALRHAAARGRERGWRALKAAGRAACFGGKAAVVFAHLGVALAALAWCVVRGDYGDDPRRARPRR